MGGRVGGGTKFIVRQTTRTSRRRKYPRAEEFVTEERSSYAPLFSFSVCGASVSRGFKRKTLRLFDARFPLTFFPPVPGLITRVR